MFPFRRLLGIPVDPTPPANGAQPVLFRALPAGAFATGSDLAAVEPAAVIRDFDPDRHRIEVVVEEGPQAGRDELTLVPGTGATDLRLGGVLVARIAGPEAVASDHVDLIGGDDAAIRP
jgi:hypothetical protein